MAIPADVVDVRWDEARNSLYDLQTWLLEDPDHRDVQIACEYRDIYHVDLIVYYRNPQDALAWVDAKLKFNQDNWNLQPMNPKLTLRYTDLTVEQQPIDPPPPPPPPPPEPYDPPPEPTPGEFPSNLSTDSFTSARESLLDAQAWENFDPNRRLKITINENVFEGTAGAIAWLDTTDTYLATQNPRPSMMLYITYEDVTGQTILPPPTPVPEAKYLDPHLRSLSTSSSSALQTFVGALETWAAENPEFHGCLTAECSISPPQPGFANNFSAPNLASLASWVSGVNTFIADGVPVTANITVTSVPCGTTPYNGGTE